MRICFSKPVAADEVDVLIRDFAPSGYDCLQLKTGQFLPWVDDPRGFLDRLGERREAAEGLIYFDELDDLRLDAVVRFAASVGAQLLVFCHNRSRESVTPADRVAIARLLSQHGEKARDLGVTLSLHHHFDQPVMLPEDVREFWRAATPGAVGLTVDTAHLAKSGVVDLPAFIREFGAIIDNVHLKDYADGQWRIVGEGDLDLVGVLQALDEVGFDGWLCVDEETDAPLVEALMASRNWLRRNLPSGDH